MQHDLTYDGNGRVTAVYTVVPAAAGGVAATRSFGFGYDEHHNLVEATDSRGGRTQYRYDALGRPVERSDVLGRVTRVTYDRLGQPTVSALPTWPCA